MNVRGIRMIVGLIGLVLIVAITGKAIAAAMAAGQPTAVVTVRLAAVLEKLDQRAQAEVRLKKMADDLKSQDDKTKVDLKAMEDELRKVQEKLKTLGDGPEHDAVEEGARDQAEKFAYARLKYQAWLRVTTDKIDIERSLILQDLYRSIKQSLSQMASALKFDIVLVDDSQGDLTTNPESRASREAQVLQQIIGRRMLYGNPTIDITDDLIERMNNAHKAIGPKSAP